MWKFIFAFLLIMHGLANLSGFFEAFSKRPRSFYDRPWIFSKDVKLQSPLGRLFGLFWLLSTVFLLASGVGLIFQQGWWVMTAVAGMGFSLLAILPWWKTVVPGARFGAIFDVVGIILLLSPLRTQILALVSS